MRSIPVLKCKPSYGKTATGAFSAAGPGCVNCSSRNDSTKSLLDILIYNKEAQQQAMYLLQRSPNLYFNFKRLATPLLSDECSLDSGDPQFLTVQLLCANIRCFDT